MGQGRFANRAYASREIGYSVRRDDKAGQQVSKGHQYTGDWHDISFDTT